MLSQCIYDPRDTVARFAETEQNTEVALESGSKPASRTSIWISTSLLNSKQPGSPLASATGKTVIGAAYRPGSCGDNDLALLEHLDQNIDTMRQHGKHMILAGDFNVHSTSWLGSSRTTIAGEFLEEISATHCLVQHVTQPTRGPNTLDLVLSDFPGTVHTAVSSPIGCSDHCVVLSNFQEIHSCTGAANK